MQVFLSVGRVTSSDQRRFLDKLEKKLASRDIHSKTIGRNAFTAAQPLDKVKEEMRKSRGLLVVATERARFEKGYEYVKLDQAPTPVAERRYATPWHQIELAMASMLSLPTLVVMDEGLFQEGLLEDKYGWFVFRMPIDAQVLESDEFNGVLDDWCFRVKEAKQPGLDLESATMGQLFSALRPGQLWAMLVSATTLLASVFALGGWAHAKGLVGPERTVSSNSPPSVPSIPVPKAQPQPVAEAFLAALDTGEPHKSWLYVSEVGRAQVSGGETGWAEIFKNNLGPLGPATSRKLIGSSSADSIPGFPPNVYRGFSYESRHANQPGVRREMVVLGAAGNGWEVASYQISPPAP